MPTRTEEEETGVSIPRPTSSTRLRARPDPFLVVWRCFSVLTSLAAILCIAVNILSAVRSFKDGSDIFDGIFRCYAVLIAFFVVLAETEWGFILKFWQVLEYWAGRGMLQIFVAVMTRAFPDYSGERKELVLLQNIASYMLLACGVVYVISVSKLRVIISIMSGDGILCIGFLKRARQQKEITREQAVKDLEELERRRDELEQLLIEERA
ncbi:Golgi apparatus membrane protein TVP [Trema orientale]|uniref:Golgi apparatus membrane protein TVP n=1 Tax=Trema orientale TaxID=63057 RepID=A0A2P5FKL4_TREOI|nr:Golgi apparatus membrane protein TVP [Trema orientale]